MAELFPVPEISAGTTEVLLSDWLVNPGDAFKAGDPIAILETEKAVVEVEAEADATLLRVLVSAGETAEVGAPMALVGSGAEAGGDLDAVLAGLGVAGDAGGLEAGPPPAAEQPPAAPAPAPREDGGRLFVSPIQMLQRLAEGGLAIVYISHRLPEIFAICDRVTVLRDGGLVDTMDIEDTTPDALVDKMVGRELKRDLEVVRESNPGEVVLSARDIRAPKVHGIDVDVRAGEIVGLGGLVGAGRSEFVRAMLGVDVRTGGEVTVNVDGRLRRVGGYQSAVRHGIAFVPEERRHDGLALSMSV